MSRKLGDSVQKLVCVKVGYERIDVKVTVCSNCTSGLGLAILPILPLALSCVALA